MLIPYSVLNLTAEWILIFLVVARGTNFMEYGTLNSILHPHSPLSYY